MNLLPQSFDAGWPIIARGSVFIHYEYRRSENALPYAQFLCAVQNTERGVAPWPLLVLKYVLNDTTKLRMLSEAHFIGYGLWLKGKAVRLSDGRIGVSSNEITRLTQCSFCRHSFFAIHAKSS